MALSSFQFSQPVLTKASFNITGPAGADLPSPHVHVHRKIIKIEGTKQAIVQLTIQLNRKMNEVEEDAPFNAEFTMQAMFRWNDTVDDNMAEELLNYNAVALLISYIRPIIATVTSASPLPTVNLPYINVIDLVKSQNEESENKKKDE